MPATRVSAKVKIHTAARSVSFVANEVQTMLMALAEEQGLDASNFVDNWRSTENALRVWLATRELKAVFLEIYDRRTDALIRRCDIVFEYVQSWQAEDEHFDSDLMRLKNELARLGRLGDACDYDLVVALQPNARDVPGWEHSEVRETSHLRKRVFSGVVGTASIRAGAEVWADWEGVGQ